LALKALVARASDGANPRVDHLGAIAKRFGLRLDGFIAVAMAAYGQQDGKKNGTFAHPSPRKRRCEIMLRRGGTMQAEIRVRRSKPRTRRKEVRASPGCRRRSLMPLCAPSNPDAAHFRE